jgi:HPt (histidine-containing phosphotransfer) domain-containing protein
MNPRASDSTGAPIDDAFLAELDADYGVELRQTLTTSFLREVTTALQEARVAAAPTDAARLQHIGHRLRGAAANFRAHSLADAATRLEGRAAVATLTSGEAGGLVDELERESDRVRRALADRAALGR